VAAPKWLQGAGGDEGDEGDDDEDEVTPNTPIPMPDEDAPEAAGAGVLPIPAPGQPAAATAEGGRRRRRRGGRRRGKNRDGEPNAPGAPAAAAPGGDGGGRRPHPPKREDEVTRPNMMRAPQPPRSSSPAPHPEAGPIRILAADPPLPLRESGEPRPVVRPGEVLPENTDGEGLAIGIPVVEGMLARSLEPLPSPRPLAPVPPRIDDVRAALGRLSEGVSEVKGVGPKMAELLGTLNVKTVEDLLFDVPRAYQDRSRLTKIGKLEAGRIETVMGTVKSRAPVRFGLRPGFEMIVEDETGWTRAKWFHVHRGMEERFPVGAKVIFAGKFEKYRDKLEVTHPEIEVLDEEDGPESFARLQPVYALTEGLSQKIRRKIGMAALETFGKDVPPSTPYWARQKRGLMAPADALARVHDPQNGDDPVAFQEGKSMWQRSLAYDELFSLQVGLALRRRAAGRERAPRLKITHAMMARLASLLPFPLTDAQEKVLAEIKRDLLMQRPMHRLLQGDVGSGKTIVALMAALVPIENRMQVAFMAPTEILAEQHYEYIRSTLERIGVKATLLLGASPKAQRDEATKRAANGEADIVVGTHALLSEGVQFKNLALAIVDEQHKFGVMQRQQLKQKGQAPHVLIMTATPIPRTLALTEFGDLDVSVIDRMPAGRSPVETRVCGEEERSVVYAQVRSDVSAGRQAYIVYPTVEGAEDDASIAGVVEGQKKLQRDVFPEFRVGVIHGRMTREEKEGVMTRFKNGAVDILAATTVVEVGIDVPNASVMVVEHAERFGMAQLHQLRGRVGRGAVKSRAFFMLGVGSGEDARERIGILERTVDGFEVAQADLDQRGPGDIAGTKQSGLPPFRMADPLRDLDLLMAAREDAFSMVNADPKLREPEHRVVHEVVRHRWRGRLNLTDTG
jgi:ATP-dependent DNA helicase RecG